MGRIQAASAETVWDPVLKHLPLEGYGDDNDGVLQDYYRNCYDRDGGVLVDCTEAVKVYIDIVGHELKAVDDHREEFRMVFMLKLAWLDPDLKNFKSVITVRDPKGETKLHLQQLEVVVTKMYANGDIEFIDLSDPEQKTQIKLRRDYLSLREPEWKECFFPTFSFINMQNDPAPTGTRKLLWCYDKGGFVSYTVKYDATFKECFDLTNFPKDHQLCRIRLTAEKTADEFQFVPVKKWFSSPQMCDMWTLDEEIQKKCTVYVRYLDRQFPYQLQRSCVNAVFHLERKGDFYFHSMLFMVFLVIIVSLCTLVIPLADVSGRLAYSSTCFLAVMAYRYTLDAMLPRKDYFTLADKYVIFACGLQVAIVLQTVILQYMDGIVEDPSSVDKYAGLVLLLAWLVVNYYLRRISRSKPESDWRSVYQARQEPYAPVKRCSKCGEKWLSKQCEHKGCSRECRNCSAESSKIEVVYYTPLEFESFVKPQRFPDAPSELKQAPCEP